MALRTAWRCFRETITRKRCGHFRHFPALRYKYTMRGTYIWFGAAFGLLLSRIVCAFAHRPCECRPFYACLRYASPRWLFFCFETLV